MIGDQLVRVGCSMTSNGLEIPPDQNEFQITSICDLISPVNTMSSQQASPLGGAPTVGPRYAVGG